MILLDCGDVQLSLQYVNVDIYLVINVLVKKSKILKTLLSLSSEVMSCIVGSRGSIAKV